MMLLQRIIKIGFIATFAVLITTACSDSNQDEPEVPEVPEEVAQVDELEYLQNNLVVLDDDGGIKERVYGRVLDESKPETVYIGVENFEDAQEIFASLFSEETTISEDGCQAKFSTRQGHAALTADSGDDGLVATADFNVEGLKHVNAIRFILNSAWPDNYDQTTYHVLGEHYQYCGWKYINKYGEHVGSKDEDMHTFVCIRECKNGVPALLVGFSNKAWEMGRRGRNEIEKQTSKKQFNEIYSIMKCSWPFFKAAFNNNGKNLLDDNEYFWINAHKYKYTIGNLHKGEIKYKADKSRYLFYKLSDK